MKKRLLSLLLVLVMLLGLLPTGVLAAEPGMVTEPSAADEVQGSVLQNSEGESDANIRIPDTLNLRQVLRDTLTQWVTENPEPTYNKEWGILALARGAHFPLEHAYFQNYYSRIVAKVEELAGGQNQNGVLHEGVLTDNSRLIIALSAIGKDATKVGKWNIVEPLGDFEKVSAQGINAVVTALIALDTYGYETSDPDIRQKYIDEILSKQLPDGGWAFWGDSADPDITAMALQALANAQAQPAVQTSIEKGVTCLSNLQSADGSYASWGTPNSCSCAQVIVACTALGVDPATDPRFVKNGTSVVDALLRFYLPDNRAFAYSAGGGKNEMATVQASYALVSYMRYLDKQTALYDMSDVKPVAQAVTIAAYDYNAGAANLAGASETGVIFRETVPFTEGLTPAEAVGQAATQADISIVGAEEGYVESINGLAAGTGGGYSGWCLRYNNDDFANGGLHSIALKAGDVLEFHYSVNPDGQTDDVGHGWYGKPIFTSLALAGQTVEMWKETVFADGVAKTTYYIRDGQGIPVKMQGSGTDAEPFRIPISLPAGTNLTQLEARYTTQLGAQYRQITGLEGEQDFSGEHSVTLSTQGGNTTYYLVQATAEPGSGSETPKPEDTISVTFRLIGATQSTEDVDVGAGKGDAQYQNWIQTETYVLNKGATVYDLFTMALDRAGLDYSATDSGYLDTIWAPEVYGGYALSEFSNGPRSGWMYLYNNTHPSVGMKGRTLNDGDRVVWHYVNDYAYEIGDWTGESSYPSLGDESTWVDWNTVVPDVRPTAGDSGAAKVDPADRKAADHVTGLISAIGSVTKDSGKKIQAARTAYDRLTDTQKALVNNYGTLTAAEKAYAALTGDLPFTDVAADHWALPAIRYVYSREWMSGVSATVFAPETTLDRGMLVTVLYRIAGEPSAKGSSFADVPAGQWYSNAVAWAAKHNIVSGYGDGRFGPEDTITREQMAVILYRFAVEQGLDVSTKGTLREFTDHQKISPWALEAMAWANGAGLISGRTAEQIAPGETATRAETAAVLMRFCAYAGK